MLDSFNESSFAFSFDNSPGVSHNNRYDTTTARSNKTVKEEQEQNAKEIPNSNTSKNEEKDAKKNRNDVDEMAIEEFNMEDEDLDDDDWF